MQYFCKLVGKIICMVSIITVNYNQSKITAALLESLRQAKLEIRQIIVVDNASPDEDAKWLTRSYPEIKYIQSDSNLGFAGGNNLGLKEANGDYIYFLNNDTEVTPTSLAPLLQIFEAHPNAGMVSPKIRFHYAPDTLQFAGYTPLHTITLRNRLIGFHEKDTGQYNRIKQTPYVHGAAMMVSRTMLNKIGPMDDRFFLYYEEIDWAIRARKAGFSLWYQPHALVYHKESVTTGKVSPLKTYYLSRNRIFLIRKNYKGCKRIIALGYQLFLALPQKATIYLFTGKIKLLMATIKAINWHITHRI